VKLMTIHAAKGMEFPVVFLCGLSEGIFPGRRADTRERLEEERRLAYVAFTRAKDRLFLSDAAGNHYDGQARVPSRFLFNAERENLDYVVELDPSVIEEARNQIEKTETFARRVEKKPDCVGKRVRHSIFGKGTVIGVPRDREGYIIQFDTIPTPRTLAPNGKLEFI
jgi:DNA helicase-2/ATP-dependent DNA helicase PcrA